MTIVKSNARKILAKHIKEPLTIGRMLLTERECESLSQKDFAKKLGISVTHLCDIEKGRKQVSPSRTVRFAKTLKLSERQFIRVALQDLLKKEGLEKVEVTVHFPNKNKKQTDSQIHG